MRAWVNGELWSESSSSTMTWSFEQMIEHVSRDETLHAGEILGSGTVGFGCGLENLRFLADGGDVVLEIAKIVQLRNRLVAASDRKSGVSGKSGSVRVYIGVRRIIKKKKQN